MCGPPELRPPLSCVPTSCKTPQFTAERRPELRPPLSCVPTSCKTPQFYSRAASGAVFPPAVKRRSFTAAASELRRHAVKRCSFMCPPELRSLSCVPTGCKTPQFYTELRLRVVRRRSFMCCRSAFPPAVKRCSFAAELLCCRLRDAVRIRVRCNDAGAARRGRGPVPPALRTGRGETVTPAGGPASSRPASSTHRAGEGSKLNICY